MSLILASRSPQRRAILERLGIAIDVHPADVREECSGDPEQVVTENALRKARAVSSELGPERFVLGADTAVALDGHLYGKARDRVEARAQIERLSARDHDVWSAVALVEGESERVGTARTTVSFKRLDEQTIDWYLQSREWEERAGSYAIQGKGAVLVERIDGDYWNVVGLPVPVLLDLAPELLAR
jgi:septum formation protein